MKVTLNSYPFSVYSETKTSKAGKEYTATSVRLTSKDVNGDKVSTYFNLLDERDLLVLSNLCNKAFFEIVQQKTVERFGKGEKAEDCEQEPVDNSVPF